MSSRWLYHVAEIKLQLFGKSTNERIQEELSRLGQQGWELVSAVQSSSYDLIRLFMKKPA